jgi:hypothetical protein
MVNLLIILNNLYIYIYMEPILVGLLLGGILCIFTVPRLYINYLTSFDKKINIYQKLED